MTITDGTAGPENPGTAAETFARTGTDPLDLPVRMPQPTFTPRHEPPLGKKELGVVADRIRNLPGGPDAGPSYRSIGEMLDAQRLAPGRPPLPVRVPGAEWDAITAAWPVLEEAVPAGPRTGRHAAPAPAPAPGPVPVPEPSPDGTWLRDFLADALQDAADGAVRLLSVRCQCREPHDGWCPRQRAGLDRTDLYARLAGLLKTAPGDRAAITALLAEEWREDDAAADGNGGAR